MDQCSVSVLGSLDLFLFRDEEVEVYVEAHFNEVNNSVYCSYETCSYNADASISIYLMHYVGKIKLY